MYDEIVVMKVEGRVIGITTLIGELWLQGTGPACAARHLGTVREMDSAYLVAGVSLHRTIVHVTGQPQSTHLAIDRNVSPVRLAGYVSLFPWQQKSTNYWVMQLV